MRTYETITAEMEALENSGQPYEAVAEQYEALSRERDAVRAAAGPEPLSPSLKRHIRAIRADQRRQREER